MHPYFYIGEMKIAAYSCCSVIAALLALVVAALMLRRRAGLSRGESIMLPSALALAFLLGARLLNFLLNPEAYGGALRLTSLSWAGFSLYGGLLAALAMLILWARLRRRQPWPLLDALFIPGGAAIIVARLGCFLNGCCGGIVTNSPLGMVFPARQAALDYLAQLTPLFSDPQPQAIWPTQLLEMGGAALGLAVLAPLYLRRKLPEGAAALLYAAWFSACRWAILPLRSLPYAEIVTGFLYPLLYASIILIALILLPRRWKAGGACSGDGDVLE